MSDPRLILLRRTIVAVRESIDSDLPVQQLALFLLVAESGEEGVTMPEAVSKLGMGQTSVSKNAKALSKYAETTSGVVSIKGHDLVAVAPDIHERRRLCMTLTPKGKAVLNTILSAIHIGGKAA